MPVPVSLQECTAVFDLGLGIPLTFLLTAIISSLLTSLITYLCLVRGRCHKPTTFRARAKIELQPNLAYGQVTRTGSDGPAYEVLLN